MARALGCVVVLLLVGCADSGAGIVSSGVGSGGAGGAVVSSNAGVGGGTSQVGVGGAAVGSGGSGGSIGPINEGYIGGPCDDDGDCMYDGGFCLPEAEGFPQGMCSLDCSQFCPDGDDTVTTFCIDPERLGTSSPEGLCTTRCDYGESPSGCRAGYQCQAATRYGDSDVEVFACVPGEDNPYVLSECEQILQERGVAFSPAINPMASPDSHPNLVCDVDTPIYLTPYLADVSFRPSSLNNEPAAMFTACEHGLAMLDSAVVLSDMGVTDLVHYGVYNCRVISGSDTLSEHAYANAIDIAGVATGDGDFYTVLGDWEMDQPNPTTPGGELLYDFVHTIFDAEIYNIILTPDYNAAHEDHFHCDLTPGSRFLQ